MTIDEICRSFHISREKLLSYEKSGLLKGAQNEAGLPDYQERELRRLGLIHSLLRAGIGAEVLERNPVLLDENGDGGERVRILKRQRGHLLEDIHEKQQSLDCLDYIIREIKESGRGGSDGKIKQKGEGAEEK
ncbi:MAG: MerR family transcriptional regulator [Synergistaceae bacterium]|nr:MerR family transcriptional regulator [Synergistaceae bacterium]